MVANPNQVPSESARVSVAPYIVTERTSVREALEVINLAPSKIALVTDQAGRLSRTITDGDVRRGLLQGVGLDCPVLDLPGRQPVTCMAETASPEIQHLLEREDVRSVVLTDASGCPVGIVGPSDGAGVIHMSPPHIGDSELEFVKAAFTDNWVAPAGPNLDAFESRLRDVSGRRHALAVASGTAALHLALRVLGVEAGDLVYVSDLTFVASLQPVLYESATPVLIDSEPQSWNMSPQALERRLERDARNGRLPRAIMLVHIYGQPPQLREIHRLAEKFGVLVVEDAAESLGASYDNRPSGAHGVLAAYSFNGNKIITTSGGGALVGDDPVLLARARMLSTQGRDPVEHYQHSEIAYNYRMSNVLAGIGIGQLQLLAERVETRRAIYRRYREGLSHVAGIGFQEEAENSRGNRWLTVITLDPERIAIHPYQLMRELRERGVETRPGWKPMHMQPLCRHCEFEPHSLEAPVSSRLFLQSLCLPSGSSMTADQQDGIIERIKKLLGA